MNFGGVLRDPPARVLVRLPNWIGDIVMATPALAAVRRHWPDAQLTVAGPGHAAPLLAGAGLHDVLVELPSRRVGSKGGEIHASIGSTGCTS